MNFLKHNKHLPGGGGGAPGTPGGGGGGGPPNAIGGGGGGGPPPPPPGGGGAAGGGTTLRPSDLSFSSSVLLFVNLPLCAYGENTTKHMLAVNCEKLKVKRKHLP